MRIGAAAPAVATVEQGVQIGAAFRGARRIKLERTMGGAALLGHSGQMGARGEVVAVSAQDGPEPSIWSRRNGSWPPVSGDSARASIGTADAGRWGVLQGLIRSVSRVGPHMWRMPLADEMAPLRNTVSMDPLCASMPPNVPGESRINPGLSADYVAHRAFRACGITNTPPVPDGFGGVAAPMQGSMWPEVGTLIRAGLATNEDQNASFGSAPWGWAMQSGLGKYLSSRTDNLPVSASFIALMCPPSSTERTDVILRNNPQTATARLTVNANRSVAARFWTGTEEAVLTLPASQSWTRVVAAARGGTLTLARDDGTSTSMPFASGNTWSNLDVDVQGGALLAGLLAGNTTATTITDYLGFVPNLRMHRPVTLDTRMMTLHRIHEERALDLIVQIARATLRACWRDEDGVVQWMPWCVAVSREAVTDVTSESHALEKWEESESLDDKYRRVVVTAEWPETITSRYPEQLVFQGRGETIETPGQTRPEVMQCPTDETWIGVDFPAAQLGLPGWAEGWRSITAGRGSMRGGVLVGPGDRTRWPYPPAIDVTAVHTAAVPLPDTPDAWRLEVEYVNHPGIPNEYDVAARTPNDEAVHSSIPRWLRDEPLPIYRAYTKATWVDVSASAGNGHPLAGALDHNGGRWVQQYDGSGPRLFANWLAQYVLDPLGTIRLPILHDPRLQVGDVINYVDSHRHGIALRCLVVGIEQESWDETTVAGQDMTLSLVVLAVVRVNVTYDDARRASPGTYTDDQSRHAGRTYTEVTAALTGGS